MDSTSIIELNAENIGELHSGAFGIRINKCLEQLVKDIIDRPVNGAGKPETRKLKIQLELVPEAPLGQLATNKVAWKESPCGTGYYIWGPDGRKEFKPFKSSHREDHLAGVGELPAYLESEHLGIDESCAIYVFEDRVEAQLNNNPDDKTEPRGTVEVPLKLSKEVTLLSTEAPNTTMARRVREVWPEALGDVTDDLYRVLSRISFSDQTTGHSHRGQSRDSMGAEAVSEVTSDEGDLAEFERLTLNLRVFTDPTIGLRVPVKCLLLTNSRERLFQIVPVGSSLDDAIFQTKEHIREMLSDVDYPVYVAG